MTDLKLIDELLVSLRDGRTWQEVERDSYIARQAITRLRQAWKSGEMPMITLSLADYFEGK